MISRTVNLGSPVNPNAAENRALAGWWGALNQGAHYGGARLLDLRLSNHASLTSTTWSGFKPPGGYGSIRCTGGGEITIAMPAIAANVDFYLEFWHYPVTWPGAFTALLDDTAREWSVFFDTSGERSFDIGPCDVLNFSGTYGMTAGSWWCFAMTRVGDAGRAYVNGVQIGARTGVAANTAAAATLSFGGNPSGGSTYDGYYDGIRLALGRGLSDADALASYRERRLGYPTALNWITRDVGAEAGGAAVNRRRRLLLTRAA